MIWFDILVQALGFIGIGLNIIALQFNKHWKIVLLRTIGSALFVVQYILLGAYTGAAMDGIGLIRNLLFMWLVSKEKPTQIYIVIFCIITVGIGIYTWEGWLSILAIIAKVVSTIGYGIRSPRLIRALNIPSNGCWIAYNTVHLSIAGVIDACLGIASAIIGEIRYTKKEKKLKISEKSNDLKELEVVKN